MCDSPRVDAPWIAPSRSSFAKALREMPLPGVALAAAKTSAAVVEAVRLERLHRDEVGVVAVRVQILVEEPVDAVLAQVRAPVHRRHAELVVRDAVVPRDVAGLDDGLDLERGARRVPALGLERRQHLGEVLDGHEAVAVDVEVGELLAQGRELRERQRVRERMEDALVEEGRARVALRS